MRFDLKTPCFGEKKVRYRFPIIPRIINGKFVWLEKVKITYRFEGMIDDDCSLLSFIFERAAGWEVYDVDFIKKDDVDENSTNE